MNTAQAIGTVAAEPAGTGSGQGAERGAGRLVAVVVTHNRLDKLKATVARLLDSPGHELAALVVADNASTDGTSEWLAAQEDPRLDICTSTENRGGAGGFEMGMRRAMEQHAADWLVVMDDDACPAPGALAAFHARPRPLDTALAAAVYFPDGQICEMNRPSVNPFWNPSVFLRTLLKARNGYHIPYTAYEAPAPMPIDLTSFVGLFLPRRMVEAAGYPDPGLFLYGDDVIYTLGLRRRGETILFDPALRFEHDCSTFQNDRHRVFRPLWKVYYAYRNGLMMYRRAAGLLFWPLLLVVLLKWRLTARRYGTGQRAAYLRLLRHAAWDGVRGRTGRSHARVLELAGED
ncbi:glycosyltransferase [Leisingera sp. F5]|uniref:glycosyltransferase n=1 Tax=Leisingera sp. F5 TaxID=1813816 RepID=UPI000B10A38D|nr:glycosyltransferase [Leisingera sp. F5]